MLKPLAVAASLLILVLSMSAARGEGTIPRAALVRVTAQTAIDRDDGVTLTQAAWIRDRHGTRIGWAITVCAELGEGGPLGSATSACSATYLFPKGRIQAAGTRKVRSSYVLAVTGGTGLYSNVGGQLLVETVDESPRVERLLFSLEP